MNKAFYFKVGGVLTLFVVLFLGGFLIYRVNESTNKQIKIYRQNVENCITHCGVLRSKFMDDKCYCAIINGWKMK